MQPRPPDIIQNAIIGCLINWPNERDTVASMIQPEDFTSNGHRACYVWMLAQETYDLVTLVHGLDKVVSGAELADWAFAEATRAFLPRYCLELKESVNRIRLYDLASDVRAMYQQKTFSEMKEHIEATLSRLSIGSKHKTTMRDSKDLVMQTLKRIERRYERKGELTGIPYGWEALDSKTNGMHRGDLIIVAGRPSMGKSAFAGNVFEAVTNAGYFGVLFSLEMGSDQVMDRMTASVGHVKYGNIRSGLLGTHDVERFHTACERMHRHKMKIDDAPNLSLSDLKTKCRKIKAEDGLDFVVVDYLQLMKLPAKENRVQAIGEISRGLKLLARELDVAVMALSQLNRGVDGRTDKRPTMSDLRDSGELEQDADVILFPFRPAAYCDKCRDRINDAEHDSERHQMLAEIIIEKQRNGERNLSIPMVWHGKYQRFEMRQVGH